MDRCDECKYYDALNESSDKRGSGYCFRHAPMPMSVFNPSDAPNRVIWPIVAALDACGEFKRRKPE